ncbi:alanine racemase [Promicromonospora thailandica]|uniref:Alanine racemase n=2 Tax=Promicromonospora thailandica TaxID=765201 RepID=A0A9X2JUT8_9MICO|nr:alanine racemase [Promicromonospora thailandica]
MDTMAEAVVDLDAIAHNARTFVERTGSDVMAIVKANGFGHGATRAARAALAGGATWLGVAGATEALALRADGITAPVLIWMYPPGQAFEKVLLAGIDVSVATVEALDAVAEAARATLTVANVHLKLDTGMSRGGALSDDWPALFERASALHREGAVHVRGIWSHLASAEEPDMHGLPEQLDSFDVARRLAADAGLEPEIVHVANSAAALRVPRSRFDLQRVGIGLYGVEPVPGEKHGLRPAMTVRAQVLLTKRVPAGTGVNYGLDYVTSTETTLALVPLGFADGVPRQAAGVAEFLLNGVRCPVAGRVAMDQVVLDVGDLPVRAGDVAVMFGPGDHGEPTVHDWARWAGTNTNDILTGIGARVPRRYEPQP